MAVARRLHHANLAAEALLLRRTAAAKRRMAAPRVAIHVAVYVALDAEILRSAERQRRRDRKKEAAQSVYHPALGLGRGKKGKKNRPKPVMKYGNY